jgi:micrococcal nuclease
MSKARTPFMLLLLAASALAACTTAPPPAPQVPPIAHQGSSAPQPSVVHPGPPATDQSAPGSPVLVGTVVKVTDGDTIKVQLASGPITVRFSYVDAPEHDQPWGAQSTAALARRLGGQQVELEVETQDQYERLVAVVYLRGENMNAWLVKQGHAWAYRAYLKEAAYCVWESDARQARLGLWHAAPPGIHAPWEWRRVAEGKASRYTDYSRETIASCVAAMPRAPRG